MSEYFYEQLVKREKKRGDKVLEILTYVVLVLFVMIGGFFIGVMAPILAVVIGVFLRRFFFESIEESYEYSLFDQEMRFSVFKKRQKEPDVYEIDLTKIDVIAKKNSERIRDVKPDQFLFFSSMKEEADVYAMLFTEDGKKYCILFDPDETMLKNMKMFAGVKLLDS